jgi:hypothetical protein
VVAERALGGLVRGLEQPLEPGQAVVLVGVLKIIGRTNIFALSCPVL